jgi:hypothetical protein
MSITTVTITGKVLTPDGLAPKRGTVTAKLSQPARALDATTADWVASEASDTLGADGSVTLSLAPNDALTPSGTVYVVTYSVVTGSGRPVQWTERWSLASSPSTIAIGDVTRVAVASSNVVFVAGPAGSSQWPSYDVAAVPAGSAALVGKPFVITQAGQQSQVAVYVPHSDGVTFSIIYLGQGN